MRAASGSIKRLLITIALIALAPLALGTWMLGRPFVAQFFYSPFLWMSLAPLSLAVLSVRKGFVSMRSGDRVYRDQQPRFFLLNVRFMLFAGALLYGINVVVAWVVMSRGAEAPPQIRRRVLRLRSSDGCHGLLLSSQGCQARAMLARLGCASRVRRPKGCALYDAGTLLRRRGRRAMPCLTGGSSNGAMYFHGRGGIRTHGTLLTYTHFPGVRLKPLGHPSRTTYFKRNSAPPRATASRARCLVRRTG